MRAMIGDFHVNAYIDRYRTHDIAIPSENRVHKYCAVQHCWSLDQTLSAFRVLLLDPWIIMVHD